MYTHENCMYVYIYRPIYINIYIKAWSSIWLISRTLCTRDYVRVYVSVF